SSPPAAFADKKENQNAREHAMLFLRDSNPLGAFAPFPGRSNRHLHHGRDAEEIRNRLSTAATQARREPQPATRRPREAPPRYVRTEGGIRTRFPPGAKYPVSSPSAFFEDRGNNRLRK